MWDTLAYIVPPVSGAVTFAGIIGMASMLLRWRARSRFEQQVHARLEQVKRDLQAWECWRCGSYFESEQRPRPLCLCNECLDAYLQEVA